MTLICMGCAATVAVDGEEMPLMVLLRWVQAGAGESLHRSADCRGHWTPTDDADVDD